MARRKFGKSRCVGGTFLMKMKGGLKRCACLAKGQSGKLIPMFQKGSKCPVGTESMSFTQAVRKHG